MAQAGLLTRLAADRPASRPPAGATPAVCQSAFSFWWVPDSSPREMNVACAEASRLKVATAPPASRPGNRHILYRFHVLDPIRFRQDLRVTIQALGWRSEGRTPSKWWASQDNV